MSVGSKGGKHHVAGTDSPSVGGTPTEVGVKFGRLAALPPALLQRGSGLSGSPHAKSPNSSRKRASQIQFTRRRHRRELVRSSSGASCWTHAAVAADVDGRPRHAGERARSRGTRNTGVPNRGFAADIDQRQPPLRWRAEGRRPHSATRGAQWGLISGRREGSRSARRALLNGQAQPGADLPLAQATVRPATLTFSPGEIRDIEFTPRQAGHLTLQYEMLELPPTVKPTRVQVRVTTALSDSDE